MKLNSTERAALTQILKDENNKNVSLEKGAFHGDPVLRIRYHNGQVECCQIVTQAQHAESLGWQKCLDAPFPSDTWYHENHKACEDG